MRQWPYARGRPINPSLYAAYRKGLEAGLAGQSESDCPYEDKRKPSGRLSWSRAFQNAWRDGLHDAKREREQALITLECWRSRR